MKKYKRQDQSFVGIHIVTVDWKSKPLGKDYEIGRNCHGKLSGMGVNWAGSKLRHRETSPVGVSSRRDAKKQAEMGIVQRVWLR
jgi:hypothetical protein